MAAQLPTSTLPTTPVSPLPIARPRRGAISIAYGSDEHHRFMTQLHLPVPLAASMHIPDLSDLAIAITDVVDLMDVSSSNNTDASDEESIAQVHDNDVPLPALVPRKTKGLLTRRAARTGSAKSAKVAPVSLAVAVPKAHAKPIASSRNAAAHAI